MSTEAEICQLCHGTGKVVESYENGSAYVPCPECNGIGEPLTPTTSGE